MSDARKSWITVTESRYPWERDALDFVRDRFPDHEPYRAWANFEFIALDGSINEVDLLVLSPVGFFLVEIKSRPGRVPRLPAGPRFLAGPARAARPAGGGPAAGVPRAGPHPPHHGRPPPGPGHQPGDGAGRRPPLAAAPASQRLPAGAPHRGRARL